MKALVEFINKSLRVTQKNVIQTSASLQQKYNGKKASKEKSCFRARSGSGSDFSAVPSAGCQHRTTAGVSELHNRTTLDSGKKAIYC